MASVGYSGDRLQAPDREGGGGANTSYGADGIHHELQQNFPPVGVREGLKSSLTVLGIAHGCDPDVRAAAGILPTAR